MTAAIVSSVRFVVVVVAVVVVRTVGVITVVQQLVTLRSVRVEAAVGEAAQEGEVVSSGLVVRAWVDVQVKNLRLWVADAVTVPWDQVRLAKRVVLTPVDYVVSNAQLETLFASFQRAERVYYNVRCDQITSVFVSSDTSESRYVSTSAFFVRGEGQAVVVNTENGDPLTTVVRVREAFTVRSREDTREATYTTAVNVAANRRGDGHITVVNTGSETEGSVQLSLRSFHDVIRQRSASYDTADFNGTGSNTSRRVLVFNKYV